MSSQRARANHSLYLARIQIAAWQSQLAEQQIPSRTLAQAFLPAIANHLRTAYGSFLLALSGFNDNEVEIPRGTAELPTIAEGKMLPPEVTEFSMLEQEGWLQELLAATDFGVVNQRSSTPVPGALAVAPAAVSPDQALAWCDALESLFDRMGDSLDEY